MKMVIKDYDKRIFTGLMTLCVTIGLLSLFRMYYFNSRTFIFLIWNVFLAWVPLGISYCLYLLKPNKYLGIIGVFAWLCFFPNAPYVITDFIHLFDVQRNIIGWYNVVQVFFAAYTSILLALFSIFYLRKYMLNLFPRVVTRIFIALALMLSCFGIYLGRFERLNSWHVVTSPFDVLVSIKKSFWIVTSQLEAFLFLALFFIVLCSVYISSKYLLAQE
jgi:uncharacterized membrane protein